MSKIVEIPCEVGDILYRLFRCDSGVEIDYLVADQITIKENNIIEVRTHNGFDGHDYFTPQNFGKVIFTSEEEAEKRKEEINNKLKVGEG